MAIVETFKEAVIAALPPAPVPPFTFRIGWADSYDNLFNERFAASDENSVLDKAVSGGRVLISGRGGSAKTVLLNRIVRTATQHNFLPVKVSLQRWSGSEIETWKKSSDSLRLAQLIETAGIQDLSFAVYASLPPNLIKLLIVDGLNELPASIGQQVIELLDAAVTGQPGTKILVSDRLVRRELRAPHRWSLGSILPLSDEEVRRHLADNAELLAEYNNADADQRSLWQSPFFFDAFLKHGDKGIDKSSTFDSFMSRIRLSDEELQKVSAAAFAMYSNTKSRTFQTADFERETSPQITEALVTAGVLKTDGAGHAYFVHHLAHDYFAARYLAANRRYWNHERFDIISFDASSFDSLAMTLEQIASQEQAETFLKALFDWNPYAAAYCIAEQKHHSQLPYEMKLVVFAMMAERKFNLFDATRQRAQDALLLLSDPAVEPFVAAKSLTDVIRAVSSLRGSAEWFRSWQQVFSAGKSMRFPDNVVREIQSKDSILGWTISNVLKRTATSSTQIDYVTRLTVNRIPVVRWRAVHTLGAFPSTKTLRTLRTVLRKDRNTWVRFGTVRSIVEVAALGNASVRNEAFGVLRTNLDQIAGDNRTRNELESALLISRVERPAEWRNFVANILERLYVSDTTAGARERMERIARRFNALYR